MLNVVLLCGVLCAVVFILEIGNDAIDIVCDANWCYSIVALCCCWCSSDDDRASMHRICTFAQSLFINSCWCVRV